MNLLPVLLYGHLMLYTCTLAQFRMLPTVYLTRDVVCQVPHVAHSVVYLQGMCSLHCTLIDLKEFYTLLHAYLVVT